MDWGFSWLLNFVDGFFSAIIDILRWCVDGCVWALKSGLYWIFDGLLTTVLAMITSLDFTSYLMDVTGLWSVLPSQVSYLISQTGFTQGLSMISYALTLRLMLNLIPGVFTRV